LVIYLISYGAAFATFLCPGSSINIEWSKYVDPHGKFEILMPDSVTHHATSVATPLGELSYISLRSTVSGTNYVVNYSLDYCDYPEGTFSQDSTELIELVYDETIASAVEAVEGELIYSSPAELDYLPGRLWKIDCPQKKLHIKSKALVVGDRYYCLTVHTPEMLSVEYNGERFFDSFKLLGS
jgi:hypothetical protein